MKNSNTPSFKNDQYFILNKGIFKGSLNKIEKIVKEDHGISEPFEKVWIPENQIKGSINKINRNSFELVNNCFFNNFKDIIEKETCLKDLELVAVRRNILNKNDSVSMHKDFEGYVVIINIPERPKINLPERPKINLPERPKPEEDDQENESNQYKEFNKTFEGGNILFKKDNGEIVEIELKSDEILIAKCTNEHGVKEILSGTRESIALFSRPKS